MKQTRYWELGEQGEAVARTWLKRQGYWVVPTSLIETGGAPSLEAWLRGLILPDNQVFGPDGPRWVEVKTKSRATYHQNSKRWEHGMLHRHWLAYLRVQNQTKIPAHLCIVEVESGLFLLAPINRLVLPSRVYEGQNMPGGQPHIFFPRDAFDWYEDGGAGICLLQPIAPVADRTKAQGSAPAGKQLAIDWGR